MNHSDAKTAVNLWRYNEMVRAVLDLHEIARLGEIWNEHEHDVGTMQSVISIIRVIKSYARELGDKLMDDGIDIGVPNLAVHHIQFDAESVTFGLYDDDNHPEDGVEAIVRKYWTRP